MACQRKKKKDPRVQEVKKDSHFQKLSENDEESGLFKKVAVEKRLDEGIEIDTERGVCACVIAGEPEGGINKIA